MPYVSDSGNRWIGRITAMPFTDDVLTAFTGGTLAGLTGSCWVEIIATGLTESTFYGCGSDSVRDSSFRGQRAIAV